MISKTKRQSFGTTEKRHLISLLGILKKKILYQSKLGLMILMSQNEGCFNLNLLIYV